MDSLLTLEECEEACEEYRPEVSYLQVLQSIIYHKGLGEWNNGTMDAISG